MQYLGKRQEALIEKYKIKIDREGTHIPPGWLGLVERAFEELILAGWNRNVLQIKQKFAGLVLLIDFGSPEELYDIVAAVEVESYTVCEVCGGPGVNIGNFMATRCLGKGHDAMSWQEIDALDGAK